MLTVEELVIESLYHRLVLVSVKRHVSTTPESDEGTSLDDDVDEDAPAEPSCIHASQGSHTSTGTGGGLGFLVLNSVCPPIKRAYGMTPTFSLGENLIAGPSDEAAEDKQVSNQVSIAQEFIAEHGLEVTEDVEMVLKTSEIQLMKTTLRSPELQVEMPPTWHFGVSVSPDDSEDPKVLIPRGISLDNCDQFSIVKVQDKRDPSGHSLVLVQTKDADLGKYRQVGAAPERPAIGAKELRKAKSMSEVEIVDRSKRKLVKQRSVKVTPVPTPVLTSQNMAVFVEQGDDFEEELEENKMEVAVSAKQSLSRSKIVKDAESIAQHVLDNEFDSGIWDMIKNLHSDAENSTTGSIYDSGTDGKIANGQMVVDEQQGSPVLEVDKMPFKMTGTYRMFNIDQNTECSVRAVEPVLNGVSTSEGISNKVSNEKDFWGSALPAMPEREPIVDTITKPVAEVQFAVEAGETELEKTMSSIKDIRCKLHRPLQAGPRTPEIPSPTETIERDDSSSTIVGDTCVMQNGRIVDDQSPEGPAVEWKSGVIEDVIVPVNVQVANKAVITSIFNGTSRLDSSTESREESQRSPLGFNRQDKAHEEDRGKDSLQRTTHPVMASETGVSLAGYGEGPRSPPSWKESRIPQDFSCESMYYTPPESPGEELSPPMRRMSDKVGSGGYQSGAWGRPVNSTPKAKPDGDHAFSLVLQSPSRIDTFRDPLSPMDSHSDLSDSFTVTESSEGEELMSMCQLNLPYDVPAYDKHPDWMGKLPEHLHSVPLTELIIPGSHLSLAIDREMHMDMDFSKCNYEMAEFLRKLPNLHIFNSFRGLMKKIWKAWMPKQTLTVAQQLEAGVRYLDIRISKLQGVLYGEHGLYTRPLKRYLKEIKEFLDAHTKEVVILHFGTLNQLDHFDKRRLLISLLDAFGGRLAKVGIPGKTTLEYLWTNKKQVIAIIPDLDRANMHDHICFRLVWSDFEVVSECPNNMNIGELKHHLARMDQNDSPAIGARIEQKFHVINAVLSPDMTMAFGELNHRSMREVAEKEIEGVVMEWLSEKPSRRMNIIALDFVGTGASVSSIVQLNFPKRETIV